MDKAVLFLLCGLALVCVINQTQAYMYCGVCPNEKHPAVLYCNSSFALKIKPIRREGNEYTVKILNVYKGKMKRNSYWRIKTFCTYYFREMMKPYVITGNLANTREKIMVMGACDWHKTYIEEMSCLERRGMENEYQKQCDCVDVLEKYNPLFKECFFKFAHTGKDNYGKCRKWYLKTSYMRCRKDYRRGKK